MKNKTAFLTIFLVFYCLVYVGAQEGIKNIKISQDTEGKYQINMEIEGSFPKEVLLDTTSYKMWEKNTAMVVLLPKPLLWKAKHGVRFVGVDISSKKEYAIQFRDFGKNITREHFKQLEGQNSLEKFEEDKFGAWERSVKPKISQTEKTTNSFGDIGFDLSFRKNSSKNSTIEFEASATANKNDPSNHLKLKYYKRSEIKKRFGLFNARYSFGLQGDMNQSFSVRDLSASFF